MMNISVLNSFFLLRISKNKKINLVNDQIFTVLLLMLPSMVQLRAHTTCPSGRIVWFGGKLRLIVKVAFAPVRVGASFFKSKLTSPPEKQEQQRFENKPSERTAESSQRGTNGPHQTNSSWIWGLHLATRDTCGSSMTDSVWIHFFVLQIIM